MKEGFEEPIQPEDNNEQKPEDMSRRAFLKKAGIILGGAAIAGGGAAYFEEKNTKEHERQGEAVIVGKAHKPTSTQMEVLPGAKSSSSTIMSNVEAEKWTVDVSFQNKKVS